MARSFSGRLVLGIGALFLIASLATLASGLHVLFAWTKVPGRVVDLRYSNRSAVPVYAYDFPAGTRRRGVGRISTHPPAHPVGDRVSVYVDPARPDQSRLGDFMSLWFLPLFFLVMAAAFGGFEVGFRIRRARLRSFGAYMMQAGTPVSAKIVSVDRLRWIHAYGRNPFRILARAEIEGLGREFKSPFLWDDPRPQLEGRDQVDVYVKPDDPRKYFMDLSFLPEAV